MRAKRLRIMDLLLGRVTVEGRGEDAPLLLTLCMQYHLPYRDVEFSPDRRAVRMTMSWLCADTLVRIGRREGISLRRSDAAGLPRLLHHCRRRPGIPVGILLALLLVVWGSGRLWEVRIEGNHRLSAGEILAELEAVGLTLGCNVRTLDVDAMENRLLMHSEGISWITINLMGTLAEVQIREKLPPIEEDVGDDAPANLVASRDGIIVLCEVLNGKVVTQVGRAVRRGELLVSGLYDSAVMGYRYTRARGAIYAETLRTFTVDVPYDDEIRVTGEALFSVYTLRFFGSALTFGGPRGENDGGEAVFEEEERVLRVFGRALPITLSVRRVYRIETEAVRYSPERAAEKAEFRLYEEIAAIPGMREILSKEIREEVGENGYRLVCTLRCVEDIAEQKEIALSFFAE